VNVSNRGPTIAQYRIHVCLVFSSFPSNFYLNVQNSVVGNSSSLQPGAAMGCLCCLMLQPCGCQILVMVTVGDCAGMANVTQTEFEAIALAQVRELWSQYGNLTESKSTVLYRTVASHTSLLHD
jgi:hypothetical protein